MRPFRRMLGLALVGSLALACGACTSGAQGAGDPGAAKYQPIADDVSGRTRVPAVKLLTKTSAEDPRRYEQARLIVEAWQQAGIPAELLAVRGAEVTRRAFTSKDFDAYLVVYDPTPDRLDPDNILARFTSASAGTAGSNVSGYRNSDLRAAHAEPGHPGDHRGAATAVAHLRQPGADRTGRRAA